MADSKKKSEDWDFKVSDEHLEQVDIKKKPRKASGNAATVAPSQLKKSKKKKSLQVEGVKRKKMSRTAVAKKATAEERFAALKAPSYVDRVIATVIDYGIIVASAVGADMYKDTLYYYLVEFLAQNKISQPYHPDLVKNVLIGVVVFLVSFLFVIFPTFAFERSPGKSMMKIRIDTAFLEGEEPGKMARLIREFILKPLSIISVIGLVLAFKNKGNRCLHDMILGTALYTEKDD